jgi:quercetin dioxygenase-like cupin family protein
MQNEHMPLAGEAAQPKQRMQIFRGKDAPSLEEHGSMEYKLSDENAAGLSKLVELGLAEGSELRVLYCAGGFSLTSVWFKPNYMLPIHSHDSDCLYYVVAGQLQMGNETIKAGDGFFLPANTWYSYVAGPEGLELLEFRQAEKFDFKVRNGIPKLWERMAETVAKNHERWKTAARPPRIVASE